MCRIVYYLIWLGLLVFQPVIGQDLSKNAQKQQKKALQYIESGDHSKALRIYNNLIKEYPSDTSLMLDLARYHSILSDHGQALYWIGRIIEQDNIQLNEQLIRFYVEELRLAGRYEIAKIWFEKIKLDLLTNQDSKNHKKILCFEDTAYIQVNSLDFNTASSEFCPVFYKNSLLFYSNRDIPANTAFNLAGSAEANLFISSLSKNQYQTNPQKINQLMGYGYYEGSFAFYDNFSKSILSKYMIDGKNLVKGKNKLSGMQMYTAEVDTSKNIIDQFEALPFNIHGYSVAHPAANHDGSVLYFASNIPGGYGGSDIYVSHCLDGNWGPPENLGPKINSPYDEYFPHLYQDHTLFFTSNRPDGIGNFDIYKQNLKEDNVNKSPMNLGIPINSDGDDFCFIISPDGKSGFFTSNRAESKGREDIFRFYLKTVSIKEIIDEIIKDKKFNHVHVYVDKNSNIIVTPAGQESKMKVGPFQNHNKGSLENSVPSENPIYTGPTVDLHIKPGNSYSDSDKIIANQKVRMTVHQKGREIYEVSLPQQINLSTFFDVKSQIKQSIEQIEVTEKNMNTQKLVTERTATIFRVQIAASKNPISENLLSNIYNGNRNIFQFEEEGWIKYAIGDFRNYFIASNIKEQCGVEDAFIAAYTDNQKLPLMTAIDNQHTAKPRLLTIKPETIIKSVDVFFEFNEIKISAQTIPLLEKITAKLNAHASYKIVIKGYTDYFGSDRYNLALASERALSIKNYLLKNGVNAQQIEIQPLGENEKRIDTFSLSKYNPDTEASFRKVELIVLEQSN